MGIIKQHYKRSGITYVYESVATWDPVKKQSRAKRKLIGRLDPQTGEIVPTDGRNRRKKEIVKQFVEIYITLRTVEYHADLYRDKETGERLHASFPDGVIDEVNYGGHIRAFAFILNHLCNVSIDKTKDFLSDITDGKLTISKGMINRLSH